MSDGDPTEPALPEPKLSERLREIEEHLKKGQAPDPVTVRALLAWFGAQRRGVWVVSYIRSTLRKHNLETRPDFEGTYIDGFVEFARAEQHGPAEAGEPVTGSEEGAPTADHMPADPTYRIGKLRSANTTPTSVKPQQTIKEAITIMMVNDFSQLPVMGGERDVKGVTSWTSIGTRLALGVKCLEVSEYMENPHIISADTSLFEAIDEIVNNQYVLIRDSTNKISGIVTTSDLSLQFRQLAEPFLLLGEIENHVRRIIERGNFTSYELTECCDPADNGRTASSVHDLAFGEYIRLLEDTNRWSQLRLEIDRRIFIQKLDRIRQIRNDVMHFDPDGISDEDLHVLRNFTGFLQRLQSVFRKLS